MLFQVENRNCTISIEEKVPQDSGKLCSKIYSPDGAFD